jgi:hypothetical protein
MLPVARKLQIAVIVVKALYYEKFLSLIQTFRIEMSALQIANHVHSMRTVKWAELVVMKKEFGYANTQALAG